MPVSLDRMLETCCRRNATEAWLLADKPPLVRVDGSWWQLEAPAPCRPDVEGLLNAIAPADARKAYDEKGLAEFTYHYEDRALFKVTMLSNGGTCMALFRVFPLTCRACGYDVTDLIRQCPKCRAILGDQWADALPR